MIQKRGLVVVVLFLLLLSSLSWGEHLESVHDYEAIASKIKCFTLDECLEIAQPVGTYCTSSVSGDEPCSEDVSQDLELVGDCSPVSFPDTYGCIVYTTDRQDGTFGEDDECTSVAVSPGYNFIGTAQNAFTKHEISNGIFSSWNNQITILDIVAMVVIPPERNSYYTKYLRLRNLYAAPSIVIDDSDGLFGALDFNYAKQSYKNNKGLLCGSDHYWYQCDEEAKDKLYWITSSENIAGELVPRPLFAYKCVQKDEFSYIWELQEDYDKDVDGYTQTEECADAPSDFTQCPILTVEEFQLKTKEELRQAAFASCQEDPLKYAACPICINPAAPEICGDTINNDCGGPIPQYTLLTDSGRQDPLSPDSCHANQYACTQQPRTLNDEEREQLGVAANTTPTTSYNNIHNEKFAWVPTSDGGYCCGYGGINDLGRTERDESSGGESLCLSTNPELAGPDPFIADYKSSNQNNGRCGENWCWIDSVNNAFKIITLQNPLGETYDVVSNSETWYDCKNGRPNLPKPTSGLTNQQTYDEILETTNRFYCYEEGNRWSWAECAPQLQVRENNNIKGRYEGEALYTLPLVAGDPNGFIIGKNIHIDNSIYQDYYNNDLLDFSGYTYLNFMAQFCRTNLADPAAEQDIETCEPVSLEEANLPADIVVEIKGPNNIVYYNNSVLGYALNGFSFPDTEQVDNPFLHIRVPLSANVQFVEAVIISSGQLAQNNLKVKNVYLSKDEQPLLCSGLDIAETDPDASNWLTNIDQGDPDNPLITGKPLCEKLYGTNAWLGMDNEVDADETTANCCGNQPGEYYAGSSVNQFGCWNSQPISSGETVMDVEVEATSQMPSPASVTDGPYHTAVTLKYETGKLAFYREVEFTTEFVTVNCESLEAAAIPLEGLLPSDLVHGHLYYTKEPAGRNEKCVFHQWQREIIPYDQWWMERLPLTSNPLGRDLSISNPQQYVATFKVKKSDFLISKYYNQVQYLKFSEMPPLATFLVENSVPYIAEIKFYLPQTGEFFENSFKLEDLPAEETEVRVVATLKPNAIEVIPSAPEQHTENITFTCPFSHCLFPLPGLPPYTLRNPHPELYELYFVTGTDEKTFISKDPVTFSDFGNIQVQKVAQQVLYHAPEEESNQLPAFYGCQAAEYVAENLEAENNLQYCAVKAGKFCAPSIFESSNNDYISIINTWSTDTLTHVGYQQIADPATPEEITLTVKDAGAVADLERNVTSAILPGRNFIPNAEFQLHTQKLPYWKIIDSNGHVLADDHEFVREKEVSVNIGYTLISDRIAIPSNSTLSYYDDSACTFNIYLYNNNGEEMAVEDETFPTGDNTFAVIEYVGQFPHGCVAKTPVLQLVKDAERVTNILYNSQHDRMPDNFDFRAGAACCPLNYCWNGYTCVEPMGAFSKIAEHLADGRDYRCIDSQWQHLEPKTDWNNKDWGFCEQQQQCFVASTSNTAVDATINATIFAQRLDEQGVKFPSCINDGEYLLDNYCQQGNWTSRTQFLAQQLLSIAEEEADDETYTIYCSDPRDVLLNLRSDEPYVLGDHEEPASTSSSGSDFFGGDPELVDTCFNLPSGLVNPEQNTCINNVCVIQYKDGAVLKTAFATSLNRPLNATKSFLHNLDIPSSAFTTLCSGVAGRFENCVGISTLQLRDPPEIWYSQDLNAIIYGKHGIPVQPGFFSEAWETIKELFGIDSTLSAEARFVQEGKYFRNVYVLSNEGHKIRAVQEIQGKDASTIIAEFEQFDTPLCQFAAEHKLALEGFNTELLPAAEGRDKLSCTAADNIQRLEAVADAGTLRLFWPQVSGRLRLE